MTLRIYKYFKKDLARQINACWDNIVDIIIDDEHLDEGFFIRDDNTEIKTKPVQYIYHDLTIPQYIQLFDMRGNLKRQR